MNSNIRFLATRKKSALSSEDQNGLPAMVIPMKLEEAKAGDPSTVVRDESGEGRLRRG
jgi:hypothetical protein